ncbi:MAG: hypothetical protein ACRDYY_04225 [Acidimicrobiales bacterium]
MGFLADQLEEQLSNRSQPGRDGLVFVNMRGGSILNTAGMNNDLTRRRRTGRGSRSA